jgi:hypothetical protein
VPASWWRQSLLPRPPRRARQPQPARLAGQAMAANAEDLSELSDLPAHGIFDGELVAFADGRPHFPLVCDRLLHRDNSVPLTYVIFDVLELDGEQP